MFAVNSPEAKHVAWLHDVLEDSPFDARDLQSMGVAPEIVEAVVWLTRKKDETYAEYIRSLRRSRNTLALYVKMADLQRSPAARFDLRAPGVVAEAIQQALSLLTNPFDHEILMEVGGGGSHPNTVDGGPCRPKRHLLKW